MLSHKQVWAAIDALAVRHGFSPSGLARRAGLDPTTFNPSKRFASDGRPRWPSTESLAKVLEATGETPFQFMKFLDSTQHRSQPPDERSRGSRLVPIAGLDKAALPEAFDRSGVPSGSDWQNIAFPDPACNGLFALEVAGDRFLPVYRDGDVVVAQPGSAIRRGDRVIVKTADGTLTILILHRHTASRTEFKSLAGNGTPPCIQHSDILWIARIIWASQ
ncbi:helix-turn-helix transcriptional regulator [Roseibium sp. RKSG952]|uniref:S24 family peptidase n=1 Tax=Roseibium sp. RKSG952 TaxID=2529384 RepID=UPI0012BBE2F5|nr:helix-turn-helix transcriptional regulator [Roseibium sp. RKSG952]MTI00243.1 helix-turn-helix transcriptional regulator [Roseibium sp. RKSG952]